MRSDCWDLGYAKGLGFSIQAEQRLGIAEGLSVRYGEEEAALLRLKIKALGYQIERVGNLKHPKAKFNHYAWMILDDYMTGIPTNCGYLVWRENKGWELEMDLEYLPLQVAAHLWEQLNEVCLVILPDQPLRLSNQIIAQGLS